MIPTAAAPEEPDDRTPRQEDASGQSPSGSEAGAADTGAPVPVRVPQADDAAPPQPPDDLVYRHGPGRRVYYSARQRHADATTLGRLVLSVPSFLMSTMVVLLVCAVLDSGFGLPFWIPAAGWLASGALVFHRPTEVFLARYLLGLHRPVPEEAARLEPIWREVTALSGVDGGQYQLWIEESEDLNAFAAAGHVVAVTRFALERLPSSQLAAVLAHELGHHTGGHVWASLLSRWYAAPGRTVWRMIRSTVRSVVTAARFAGYLAFGSLLVALGLLTPALAILYFLPPLFLALPYLEAAVGRQAELRADRHAAVLGFAPQLAEVLQTLHADEVQGRRKTLLSIGEPAARGSVPARLLSSHPDVPTRLHRLRHYLR
ncbi:M48 family metalloprotease [Streptomyces sp. NPDC002308]